MKKLFALLKSIWILIKKINYYFRKNIFFIVGITHIIQVNINFRNISFRLENK